ncbi:MAG: hypothetical protein ABFQ65_03265 [Nanoarchaeota archaeon]
MVEFIRLGNRKYIEQKLGEDQFEDTEKKYDPNDYIMFDSENFHVPFCGCDIQSDVNKKKAYLKLQEIVDTKYGEDLVHITGKEFPKGKEHWNNPIFLEFEMFIKK